MNDRRTNRMSPYYFYVKETFDQFWQKYGTHNRRVLFIFGLGFDPLCVPALKAVGRNFIKDSYVETFCARFTNIWDEYLDENLKYTYECLEQIRYITGGLTGHRFEHHEVEVNMFSEKKELIGDSLLINEFTDSCSHKLEEYTDIIVDISAFPRTLMFALLGYLWKRRRAGQNLFAVLTTVPLSVEVEERDYTQPRYMLGGKEVLPNNHVVWIPVLGGKIKRFETIYDFLSPKDVLPIIPFPAKNPRLGDEIILAARKQLFDAWDVPFRNVMYASGEIPFDVFRKIQDIVVDYSDFGPELSMVVSALSGRSLSLGVLLAALWSDLPICHSQPTTYRIDREARNQLKIACEQATSTLYWLDGELYEV